MNNKYKGLGRHSVIAAAVSLAAVLSGCEDDLGKDLSQSGAVSLNVNAPSDWSDGANADQNDMSSRCTSVDAASDDGSVPLYFHTIESDNAVGEIQSRGALKKTVEYFSLSAICYPGAYPEDENDVAWTPDFAHNLIFKVNGTSATGSETLQWPAGGKVRFFAFAPLADGNGAAPFTLSSKTTPGSPSITYTIPSEVKEQHDLLAACTDASTPDVTLDFKHILTAVKIVAASDMLPGKITSVRLGGVYSKGTFTPAPSGGSWAVDKTSAANYSIALDVALTPAEGNTGYKPEKPEDGEIIGNITDKTEVVGENGDLTLLMMPQVLPEGAVLTVGFTDDITGTERTLSASLAGKTWTAGKLITYSLSPSSIHIVPTVEFSRTPDDVLPYSGVWYDSEIKAYAAITQDKTDGIKYIELPRPEVEYKVGDSWEKVLFDSDQDGNSEQSSVAARSLDFVTDPSSITGYKGTFVLGAQSDFSELSSKFTNRETSLGTPESPYNLLNDTKNESANCYMIGQPGYYCFPVVYGNAYNNPSAYTLSPTADGMNYFVDYKGNQISSHKPDPVKDAVLAWQDAPDLIDDVKILKSGAPTSDVEWVCFRVRKHSITQGNALIVARDNAGEIVWSWHIWVSQHKDEWMGANAEANCHELKSIIKDGDTARKFTGNTYYLTRCNLGYCDPHNGNDERTFKLRFKVDCSKITGSQTPVTVTAFRKGTKSYKAPDFTQAEFKGSLAGDNTYYQWGRKDPMLGGIYNDKTPIYIMSGDKYSELNMENKPTFNCYDEDGVSYEFTRNKPGTSETEMGEETGVLIDWTIRNPYRFVMSKYTNKENKAFLQDYRSHWHKLGITAADKPGYMKSETSKMFQVWNASAVTAGSTGNFPANEVEVTKSIYDPCPAGYHVPQANVFSALAHSGNNYGLSCTYSKENIDSEEYTTTVTHGANKWAVTYPGGAVEFPATGMRDMSLRYYTDFPNVTLYNATSRSDFSDPAGLGGQTLPAFRMISFIATSSVSLSTQSLIFLIDNRYNNLTVSDGKGDPAPQNNGLSSLTDKPEHPAISSVTGSNNSYGFSVRPVHD